MLLRVVSFGRCRQHAGSRAVDMEHIILQSKEMYHSVDALACLVSIVPAGRVSGCYSCCTSYFLKCK